MKAYQLDNSGAKVLNSPEVIQRLEILSGVNGRTIFYVFKALLELFWLETHTSESDKVIVSIPSFIKFSYDRTTNDLELLSLEKEFLKCVEHIC